MSSQYVSFYYAFSLPTHGQQLAGGAWTRALPRPLSTTHTATWAQLLSRLTEQQRDLPATILENSFQLEFSGLLPHVFLSAFFTISMFAAILVLCVGVAPGLQNRSNQMREKTETNSELLDWP